MTTAFTELDLHPQLLQAVVELGYETPTPIQSAVIPLMLAGQDVIGQAQTGTGKTAAFALPALQNLEPDKRNVQVLVMTPTRELAIQVADAFEAYGRYFNARVLAVYGGQPYARQITRLKKGVEIVVGTPGRLLDLIRQEALHLNATRTVVLDEADEMLSMGFIEDIQAILDGVPAERQMALFSATLPTPIRRLAERYLHDPQSVTIQGKQVTLDAIEQRYYLVNQRDKLAALTRLFEVEPITSALIFARTKVGSGDLANELTVRGFPAEVLNGDLTQEARERVLNRFRQNQIKVLVATDVAARGLDIEDISHIFNFDLPEDEELYVHRIGRTGRAGKTGIAISLVTPPEQWRLRRIEGFTRQQLTRAELPTEEDILKLREEQLLGRMSVWLQRARYRRERELVLQLVEQGQDPIEIAAAALKMARAEDRQRPIAPVSEVQEMRSRKPNREQPHGGRGRSEHFRSEHSRSENSRSENPRSEHPRSYGNSRSRQGNSSHEDGMVRLALSKGKVHGVRANEVVSTIAYHAGIPGSTIGKIYIQDQRTLVDVPEEFLALVLAKTSSYRLAHQPVNVELASVAE